MVARYAAGKYALGVCDRCGFRYKLSALREEVVRTRQVSRKVCPDCYDPDHPQNQLGLYPVYDPQALFKPRPESSEYAEERGMLLPFTPVWATASLNSVVVAQNYGATVTGLTATAILNGVGQAVTVGAVPLAGLSATSLVNVVSVAAGTSINVGLARLLATGTLTGITTSNTLTLTALSATAGLRAVSEVGLSGITVSGFTGTTALHSTAVIVFASAPTTALSATANIHPVSVAIDSVHAATANTATTTINGVQLVGATIFVTGLVAQGVLGGSASSAAGSISAAPYMTTPYSGTTATSGVTVVIT